MHILLYILAIGIAGLGFLATAVSVSGAAGGAVFGIQIAITFVIAAVLFAGAAIVQAVARLRQVVEAAQPQPVVAR